MGHAITLDLPEQAWLDLQRASRDRKQAPETVAQQILTSMVADPLAHLLGTAGSSPSDVTGSAITDPVMQLAGCLSMSYSGIGDHHDEYIGESLLTLSEDR